MGSEIKPINSEDVVFQDITEFTKAIQPTEYKKVNCKFCCSAHRHAAEAEFVRINNVMAVVKFLQGRGELITYNAVRNHLTYHFGRKEIEERLKEHGEEMEKWRQLRPTKEQRLEDFIDILFRRIHLLEAHSDSTDTKDDAKDKTKVAETVAKLIDQVNKCQTELDKSREETAFVHIFIEKFAGMVELHIKNSPSREASQVLAAALVSVLDEARKLVGDLPQNE